MTIRKVLTGDQAALRKISQPIQAITPEIRTLVQDMIDTMHDYAGVGLSAVQVGVHQRVIVLESRPIEDVPEQPVFPLFVIINPEIEPLNERKVTDSEGCLSLPNWYGPVPRWTKIRIQGLDLDGNNLDLEAYGFMARVIQHEVDHLDGILFTDYIDDPTKLRKLNRRGE